MIIDCHAHFIPAPYQSEYLKWLKERENKEFGPVYLWNDPGFEDENRHLSEMERYGIDYEIITYSANCMQILEALAGPEERRRLICSINDRMAECSLKTGGKMIPLAFIVPEDGEKAVEEMERVDSVCRGYSILAGYQEGNEIKFLDHPDYEPVWKKASETGKPVFVHFASRYSLREAEAPLTGYMANNLMHAGCGQLVEDTVAAARLILSGILDQYPGLKVVFGQLGGLYPFMLERFDMLYGMYGAGAEKAGISVNDKSSPNRFLRRLSDYKSQIYVDTHSMSGPAIRCAAEILGKEQLLFGSDYPITPAGFGRDHGLLVVNGLEEELKEAILWKNGAKLMGLSMGGDK